MKQKFTSLPFDEQDKSETVKFTVLKDKGIVVCKVIDNNNCRHYTGRAIQDDHDVWDERRGRAIAFNKACKKEYESRIKSIEREIKDWKKFKQDEEKEINQRIAKLEKRRDLLNIYLTGYVDEILAHTATKN